MAKRLPVTPEPELSSSSEERVREWLETPQVVNLFAQHMKKAAETADRINREMAADPALLSEVMTI